MTFDNITGSKKLWSVRLDGEEDNEFLKLFYDWSDVIFSGVIELSCLSIHDTCGPAVIGSAVALT